MVVNRKKERKQNKNNQLILRWNLLMKGIYVGRIR